MLGGYLQADEFLKYLPMVERLLIKCIGLAI